MRNISIILLLFKLSSIYSQNNDEFFKSFQNHKPSTPFEIHLKEITKNPHITGTKANEQVRDYLVSAMKKAGFEVEIVPYDVYLPEMPGLSEIEITAPQTIKLSNKEKAIAGDIYSSHPDNSQGFNAFSGNGDVTAQIVYVNYGTKADFDYLIENGIELKGRIAIARYGGNFRGYKAKFGEQYGCVGLIIFTDPIDSGYNKGFVYPEGPYYNESALQRGALITKDWAGDPLTPFEPALPIDGKTKIKRLSENEISLPKIPVLPIGYGAATEIFKLMTGDKPTPRHWQGGLPFTYRLEGGQDLKVRINVSQNRKIQRIYNVIGTLKGAVNPNEWLIAGCHYDAWTFGAIDPNSGTAMLLSLADTFGDLAKQGKKMNRTLKICHWDAEEVGLIGSTEWVEQNKKELQQKTVAYLNADAAVSGPNFYAAASPTLKQLITEVSQNVMHPDVEETIFQHWKKDKDMPEVGNLGGGSDHLPFLAFAGIPSLNMGMGGPSVYHSNYDNFAFYEKFSDPKFNYAKTTKDIFGLTLIKLSNNFFIPLKLENYGKDCEKHFQNLNKKLSDLNINSFNFNQLIEKSKTLMLMGQKLDLKLIENHQNNKEINKILIKLEQNWLHDDGMPFGKWYQSLYVSSDPYSGYASWIMPAFLYILENKKYDDFKVWEAKYLAAIDNMLKSFEDINSLIN